MKKILLSILMLFFLLGCANFGLDTVKYRLNGRYGQIENYQSASWTERTRDMDSDHWSIGGGVEFTYKNLKYRRQKK